MKEIVYKQYLLVLLLVIFAFNQVDRFALGLLLQKIKVDLALSDTQLGFLTGIAFALFYSVLGIPIARWADRGNRVTIISVTTALWSAALALCGLAKNFPQLLLIRVGVAVGEAGGVPPAHSLIADHFTRAERPRALARYMLGIPLSSVLGYLVAGWLSEFYGWRITFMLLGFPGLILAAVAWFTLREPRYEKSTSDAASARTIEPGAVQAYVGREPTMMEVVITLWASVTFRHLLVCWSLVAFFGYGLWQWKPTFFMRSYGLDTAEVGAWFAGLYGVGALVGLYCGGELAARRAAQNERLQFKAIAVAYCSLGLIQAAMFLSSNPYLAFALLGVSTVGIYSAHGPLFAAIQSLALPRMRAMAIAVVYLVANLIGLGLGPLVAGALSDLLQPVFGHESLRYALLTLCSGYLWAAWHSWRASRTITRDLEHVQDAQRCSAREGLNPSEAR